MKNEVNIAMHAYGYIQERMKGTRYFQERGGKKEVENEALNNLLRRILFLSTLYT